MSRTILAEVQGWIPLIDHLVQKYGVTTAAVFGRAWRYCQMWDGVCKASIPTIANDLGLARSTVKIAMQQLCVDGYLQDVTPHWTGRPHIYRDTGKAVIAAKFNAEVDENPPLRNSEGSGNGVENPLRNSEGPLRNSEGHPSDVNTGPLRNSEANKKSLLKESLNQSPEKSWKLFVDQQRNEMPKSAFETYLQGTRFASYEDGIFIIQAPLPFTVQWLNDRLKSTAMRTLTGMMNRTVEVVFVERVS